MLGVLFQSKLEYLFLCETIHTIVTLVNQHMYYNTRLSKIHKVLCGFCDELLKAKMEVEVPESSAYAYTGDGNGFISDRTLA